MDLTERQRNELEYHRQHAKDYEAILTRPLSWDCLDRPERRWWNAYWSMYAWLTRLDLAGRRVLVVGCGFGHDALRLAKLGAAVHAFDLSSESLAIARALATREGLAVSFDNMPAEQLAYEDDAFDVIIATDIMHHVDIPSAMAELRRVSRLGAMFVMNEVYSHSMTNPIRHSRFVEKVLYPRMQRFIYGPQRPYITADERKLDQRDVAMIARSLSPGYRKEYFCFLVTRLVPSKYVLPSKLDRLLLMALKPLAPFLGGRVLLAGEIAK